MVSSLSTTTRSSTGRWSPLGRATAVWTLTTSSWGPFDALSCLNEGQGAVAQLQSAGYAEHGADPGPGPRPVGCRTSARPVGRLGDGVGTDNCAYKSLGICAILRVRLLRRDGPSGGAHADCDSERHRARWPLSAMPSKVRGFFPLGAQSPLQAWHSETRGFPYPCPPSFASARARGSGGSRTCGTCMSRPFWCARPCSSHPVDQRAAAS